MFVTPAFAQTAGGTGSSATDLISLIVPFVLVFAIMYFLVIRPQRAKMKQHQEMVRNVRRGDTVITSGGIIGKISKVVDEQEVQVEIAEGVRVRVARAMIQEVRAKGEPVKEGGAANENG